MQNEQNSHQEWVLFVFIYRQTKYISKILKWTNFKVAYKINELLKT